MPVSSVREALRWADSVLKKTPDGSSARDARLLLASALERDTSWVLAYPEFELPSQAWTLFRGWILQRAEGNPIAYLLGRREFYGRDFVVSPSVLIPRPETELLIEQGLKLLECCRTPASHAGRRSDRTGLAVADIGTGSGCIAVTLAAEISEAEILATDVSDAALRVARANAARHGVAGRVRFEQADLLPEGPLLPLLFDAIFSNPPYGRTNDPDFTEEVRKHEPPAALFGGATGTEVYARMVPRVVGRLREGGWLVLELGYGMADRVRALFDPALWQDLTVYPDLQQIPRCLVARKNS